MSTRKMVGYGRYNEVKLDPLAWNIGLIGESGIGKTTLVKEVCEKLVGRDGYMILDIGKEDGTEAIQHIRAEEIENWKKFDDVTREIIDFKFDDHYKNLRVIAIDTFDGLMEMAEDEVIRLHNLAEMKKDNPKRVDSIKAAFGGFQEGEKRAIRIVLDRLWELKKVGVRFIILGHTKKRDIEDPVSGQSYSVLTTNMSQKYFTSIKTKLHFLGVAYVDRAIVQKESGKKNIVTGKVERKGVIQSETRKISFRDDNFSLDSKSRFAEIVPEIPFERDAFINALQDAILAEHSKGGKPVEQARKEQDTAEQKRIAEAYTQLQADAVDESENAKLLRLIQEGFADASDEARRAMRGIMEQNGIPNFKDPNIPTRILQEIAAVFDSAQ